MTSANALDPAAAALLHPAELEIYTGSRKGRQVLGLGQGGAVEDREHGGIGRGRLRVDLRGFERGKWELAFHAVCLECPMVRNLGHDGAALATSILAVGLGFRP